MTDLCKSLVYADTPLVKLNNPEVRNFRVMCNQTDPLDELTLRKIYLPKCYEEIFEYCAGETIFGVHRLNNSCKCKDGCYCYFEKWSIS
jgi:hypothetical protein